MKTGIALDRFDDELQFVLADPLAIIPAIFTALQQVIRALGDGLTATLDLIGLLADVAADHAIDAGHFFKDTSPFLFEGG